MWSSERRLFLAGLTAAALSACGFTPVYGPGGSGAKLQGNVALSEPVSRGDFLLVQRLENRLGRAGPAAGYALDVTSSTRARGLGSTEDGQTTRFQVVGRAQFSLRDAATGAVLDEGEISNLTGYSATGSTVATLAAERDALRRLMVILGDQLVDRLLLSVQ